MTLVNIALLATKLGGAGPVNGTLTATYWAGYSPAVQVEDENVILPDPIKVTITNGVPASPINMDPTFGLACVQWIFDTDASEPYVAYTSIPDVASVDFGDLPLVDKFSYVPATVTSTPVEATQAYIVQEVQAYLAAHPLYVLLTQTAYNAIASPTPGLLYVITGP